MHVDDFIDRHPSPIKEGEPGHEPCINYARFVFMLFRLPATQQIAFAPYASQFKLFCTWEGKRWRVIGASRLGDVWLTSDFTRDTGYDRRVDLAQCSEWSGGPAT